MSTTTIIFIVLGALVLFVIGLYNSLIRLRNKVKEGWSDIDTQLKRRWDLIPNLVSTVKGYAEHEKGTFEEVTKMRTAAMDAKTPADRAKAENMLSSTLKSLFAVAENYPDLKANTNFLDLQQTLREVEEALQMSRRYYNGTVRDFNNKIEVFPNNMLAGMLKFEKESFFEVEEEARKNVKVDFNEDDKKDEK
jgi:LemA protein